jgi:hypothetical protein
MENCFFLKWSRDRISGDRNWHFSGDRSFLQKWSGNQKGPRGPNGLARSFFPTSKISVLIGFRKKLPTFWKDWRCLPKCRKTNPYLKNWCSFHSFLTFMNLWTINLWTYKPMDLLTYGPINLLTYLPAQLKLLNKIYFKLQLQNAKIFLSNFNLCFCYSLPSFFWPWLCSWLFRARVEESTF